MQPYMVPKFAAWNLCPACSKSEQARQTRGGMVPFISFAAQQALFAANPLNMLLLSLVDLTVGFHHRLRSFLTGGLRPRGPLDFGILVWNDEIANFYAAGDLPAQVRDIYNSNLHSNPLMQQYLTISERTNPEMSLPILTQTARRMQV